jgi:phosphoadenosine phosphosulfate reductase
MNAFGNICVLGNMNVQNTIDALAHLSASEGLEYVGEHFGQSARLSSSLGIEDQLLTYWIASQNTPISIFTIDTGRLFQETYDLLALTRSKYHINIELYLPDHSEVEALVNKKGPNSFFESIENRKECCHIRKVEPLRRALADTKIWITGLRAEQSTNRQHMPVAEWDSTYNLIKYNPLLHHTEEEILHLIDRYNVPVNTLHKKGFPSIGCAPCTRAIQPGENHRAGRWWWESTSKECGLHETRVH